MLEIPGNHFVDSISLNILNKIEVFFCSKVKFKKTTACSFVVQFFLGSVSIATKLKKKYKNGHQIERMHEFCKKAILYPIFNCTKSKSRNECGNLMGFTLNFTALK